MADRGSIEIVAQELGEVLGHLAALFEPSELERTLSRLGVVVADDGTLEDPALGSAVEAVAGFALDLVAVADAVRSGSATDPLGSALSVIDGLAGLGDEIGPLRAAVLALDGAEGASDLPADLAGRVVELAVVDHLESSDLVAAVLRLFGVIDRPAASPAAADGAALDLGALVRAVGAPGDVLRDRFGWGATIDFDELCRVVALSADALGVPSVRIDDRLEALWLDVEPDGTDGVRLTVALPIAATVTADLPIGNDAWSGRASATLDLPAGASATVRPGSGFAIDPGGSEPVAVSLELELATTSTGPLTIVGFADGPRLVASAITATVVLSSVPVGGRHEVDLAILAEVRGLRPVLQGAGDGLTGTFAGDDPGGVDVTIGWSPGSGITLDGRIATELSVPGAAAVGPVWTGDWIVGLALDGAVASVAATATVGGAISVLSFEIEGLGIAAELDLSGSTGRLVAFSLAPTTPTRVALAIEAPGASGGGTLAVDPDIGRYAGGLSLDVIAVGIDALVVVDTELGGADGFALFASLSIRFPGIPLGFGFTLEGVGGLLALHRRLDADALALGLRQGVVDAILFPDDPVRDAAILLPQIDEYFPLASGNTVVGPVIQIGWGMPVSLLTAQLGVVISLPEGLVAVMGSIAVALPTPATPLIELHLDALGVIDLAEGSVLITASLYDSRLLGVIELSGDMAFVLATSPSPYFALSVGGWHPSFQPPDALPSVFSNLRRIRAEVAVASNVRVTLESYLALTSNTVQFGGRFEIEASVDLGLATYSARGWFQFDVLVVFTPFAIVADVTAGVAVCSGDRELFGVDLGVHLEGPEPWFASGYGEFRFFGLKVRFEFTVGGKAPAEIPATVDVLDLVEAQLTEASAWSVEVPPGLPTGITYRSVAADAAVVEPHSRVTVRQSVVPLDHDLEVFGASNVGQARVSFAAARVLDARSGTDVVAVGTDEVVDWFAPAQFERMTAAERLGSPSYEQLASGVAFGVDGVEAPDGVAVGGGHETKVWVAPPATDGWDLGELVGVGHVTSEAAVTDWFSPARVAARDRSGPTVAAPRFEVAAITYHDAAGQRVPNHVEAIR